jgi:hypothetical protein
METDEFVEHLHKLNMASYWSIFTKFQSNILDLNLKVTSCSNISVSRLFWADVAMEVKLNFGANEEFAHNGEVQSSDQSRLVPLSAS